MKTPHKHAEWIKAWADGAEIEVYYQDEWVDALYPSWGCDSQYRIKPEPKPNFIHEINVEHKGEGFYEGFTNPNVRFEFDAETHELVKVEMI